MRFQNASELPVAAARGIIVQMPVLAVQARQNQRLDMTVVHTRHEDSLPDASSPQFADNSLRRRSILADVRKPHIPFWLTSKTGASPHAPMHSPSLSVNLPSGVVR